MQLTNTYAAAVTAYALQLGSSLGPGGGGVKWVDSIPGDHGLRPPLPPGTSAPVFVPGRGSQPPDLTNTAVIYADGASAGDPAIVARLVKVREFFLAEIPAAIARLRTAAADPSSDRMALVSACRQQAEENLATLRAGSAGPVSDRINENIAATLANPANTEVQATAAALVAALVRWQTQLQNSLPKLKSAAPPPPR